ncbi:Hypothetical protein POVR1_LOCUS275 [uncultured virus]|nr:Hypothetical protein POVR1_LOCUS275 [uncultured virus]
MDVSPVLTLRYPVRTFLLPENIAKKRKQIKDALSCSPNFDAELPSNSVAILDQLFQLYDRVFFSSSISDLMRQKNYQLAIRYNSRLTKTGGHCKKISSSTYDIEIATHVVLGTFRHGEKSYSSNGLLCYDRLDCLMNVFEHELVHYFIMITHGHIKGDPVYKSHGLYFQQLVKAYFGHTAFRHALLSKIEEVGKPEDFKVDDCVTFTWKDGSLTTGKIMKLNPKRAVVFLSAQKSVSVSYIMMRVATASEIKSFEAASLRDGTKSLVDEPRTRDDFRQGQNVQYINSKTGIMVKGQISKLNPVRAVVGQVTVPYHMLMPC